MTKIRVKITKEQLEEVFNNQCGYHSEYGRISYNLDSKDPYFFDLDPEQVEGHSDYAKTGWGEAERLDQENKWLREALEFYADRNNCIKYYPADVPESSSAVREDDFGSRARKALSGDPGTTEKDQESKAEASKEEPYIPFSERDCDHCHQKIAIRNPSGFCDHLYYPEYCKVCEQNQRTKKQSPQPCGPHPEEKNKCEHDMIDIKTACDDCRKHMVASKRYRIFGVPRNPSRKPSGRVIDDGAIVELEEIK